MSSGTNMKPDSRTKDEKRAGAVVEDKPLLNNGVGDRKLEEKKFEDQVF